MKRYAESDAVVKARLNRRPIVALETTIFSHLGLPTPANEVALHGCVDALAHQGVVPAVTAVLDGVATVGVDPSRYPDLLGPARKTAARELPIAVSQRWAYGATTVSASLALAAKAEIPVFATGGIGGVHRGAEETLDISADLDALARYPVVTVCAGAKSFLDLAKTLEYLETKSVAIVGFRTDTFPAFTARTSGLRLAVNTDSIDELAEIARAHLELCDGGLLVVTPVPEEHALDDHDAQTALDAALAAAAEAGVTGPAVTPFILTRVAESTGGEAVSANIALAVNNAALAGSLAVLLAG